MFRAYVLRPQTTSAIRVTPDNYTQVAEWIASNLADHRGVDIPRHPGQSQGHGRPRLNFHPPRGGLVSVPIPGYLVVVEYLDGRFGYRGQDTDMFDATWMPAEDQD